MEKEILDGSALLQGLDKEIAAFALLWQSSSKFEVEARDMARLYGKLCGAAAAVGMAVSDKEECGGGASGYFAIPVDPRVELLAAEFFLERVRKYCKQVESAGDLLQYMLGTPPSFPTVFADNERAEELVAILDQSHSSKRAREFIARWKHSRGEPVCIYEVVDASDEETYHTLGVYLNLEEAIRAASYDPTEWNSPGCPESGESVEINIKRRSLGEWDPCGGMVVWSRRWSLSDGDEDAENSSWVASEPEIKSGVASPGEREG